MEEPTWVIMPWRNNMGQTLQAVEDCLSQSVPTRVLLIDQGASKADRAAMDEVIDACGDSINSPWGHRVLPWHWNPPLPSLSACWNRALKFVWELGGTEALVVNNDVALAKGTVECLLGVLKREEALFVSAVGVKESQWPTDPPQDDPYMWASAFHDGPAYNKGGPDFSCFLLSKAGHQKYPFDESFIPAYCEDLDMHRRYMLGGDGTRIFSVNLPFLHYASGTIKAMSKEEKQKFDQGYQRVVQQYTQLWGGGPNQETYCVKGDPSSARTVEEVSTPVLQRRVQAGEDVYDVGPEHAEDAGEPDVEA